MPDYAASADILAPFAKVWAVLVDVERWPEWTPTVSKVERLDPGPLALGTPTRPTSCTRIAQPKLRPAVWRVTQLDREKGIFVWQSRAPGITVLAGHFLEPTPSGCRATLTIEFSGLLAPLVRLRLGKLTRQYIHTEANSLKAHCEA
jgi:hypothetical protein